jgi:Putative rhamnosyl transferase
LLHAVLTRFNVRLDEGARVPDEEWLRDRIRLFENFTVASVESQRVPPDLWVVFVDVSSPDWLVSRIEGVARVEAVSGAFAPPVARQAIEILDKKLVTTRLDCDDAIAFDYLQRVRAEAETLDSGYVNFLHGLQLADGRLYRRSDPSNPFISRVELPPFETVFAEQHQAIVERNPVRQVDAPPCWLQVIHGKNAASTVSGIRTKSSHLKRFRVDADVTDHGVLFDRPRTALRLAARVVRSRDRMVWLFRVVWPRRRRR